MILQTEKNNCGEIVTRQVINNIYKSDKIASTKLKNDCSNLLNIKDSLYKFGIETNGYEIRDFNKFYNSKKKVEFITNIIKDNKSHFVYCKKINRYYLKVFFPEIGNKIVSVKKFAKLLSNYILLIEKVNKYKINKLSLLKNKDKISLACISLFELIGISLFSVFIRIEKTKFFSLLLVPFIGILILCHYLLAIKISSNIDKNVISNYLENSTNQEDYKQINKLKLDFINYSNNKILLACLFAFILVNFIFINKELLILYLVCIVSCSFLNWIFNLKIGDIFSKVNLSYNSIYKGGSFSKDSFTEFNKNSKNIYSTVLLKNLIVYMLVIVFNVFYQFILNQIVIEELIGNSLFIILTVCFINNLTLKLSKFNNPYNQIINLKDNFYEIEYLYL